MKIPIDKTHLPALTFQEYGPQPTIDGVFSTPLRKHRDLDGSFMEYARLAEGAVQGLASPFVIRQISVSHAQPGRINAFHVHPKEVQDELWCVIAGSLLVWLVDVRDGSGTCGRRQRAVLSAESHVDRSIMDSRPFITSNVLGTQTLLEAMRRKRAPADSCTSAPTRCTGRCRWSSGS